mmetsp:Transcript_9411/g.33094  ORF Transcript_9411/g.33094 Transcript_9411/m.33094 type:complete len:225 (+) Transcript_9411:2161-2835(+)
MPPSERTASNTGAASALESGASVPRFLAFLRARFASRLRAASSKWAMQATLPAVAAACSALSPVTVFTAYTLAPLRSSSPTTRAAPARAATISGVSPCSSTASTASASDSESLLSFSIARTLLALSDETAFINRRNRGFGAPALTIASVSGMGRTRASLAVPAATTARCRGTSHVARDTPPLPPYSLPPAPPRAPASAIAAASRRASANDGLAAPALPIAATLR